MKLRLLVVALLVAGCGKGTKDQTPTTGESKVQESGAPTVPNATKASTKGDPKTEPAKAASRGPERAVYSLIDNRLSVSQVCFQTGFNHFNHFNNQFKKITGLTPGQYQHKYITALPQAV